MSMKCVGTRAAVLAFALAIAGPGAVAHEGHEHAEPPPPIGSPSAQAGGQAQRALRLADGSVFVPKPAQFRLGLRSALPGGGRANQDVRLAALVVPDPARSARIGSVERGLFEMASPAYFRLGSRVEKGTVLGYVRPLIEATELIRRRADLVQTEQDLIINEQGLIQLGMRLQGQPGMNSTTIYHENLMTDRDRLKVKLREIRQSIEGRVKLVAPVAGQISVATPSNGSLVEAGETLFEVIDPAHLWVEAQSYEAIDPAAIAAVEVRDRDGRVLPVKFVGQSLSVVEQSRPLEFELGAKASGLKVGQRLELTLRLNAAAAGMVLPQSSLIQGENGQNRVWVQTGAERFVRRDVRIESLPGGRVRVLDGLVPNERVVTEGGWLLDQVR